MMSVLKDAKQIFRGQPKMRQIFTFNAIKHSLSPKKRILTSVKDVDKTVIATSHSVLTPGNSTGEANGKGIIFIPLAPGIYTGTFTAPGRETKTITTKSPWALRVS